MSDDNQKIVDGSDLNLSNAEAGAAVSVGSNDSAEKPGSEEVPPIGLETSEEENAAMNVDDGKKQVADIDEVPGLDTPETRVDKSDAPSPTAATAPSPTSPPQGNQTPHGGNVMSIKKIQGIKVNVQVILGSVSLSVSQLAGLKKGELLSLDSSIGDPIDIFANGQLIARGEIVVVEEDNPMFGVTLSEIVDAEIIT